MHKKVLISGKLTPTDILQRLISELTSISGRIVLSEESATDVIVDGKYVISLSTSSYSGLGYTVKYGENTLATGSEYWGGNGVTAAARSITLRVNINDNVICIRFSRTNAPNNITTDMIFAVTESNRDIFGHNNGGTGSDFPATSQQWYDSAEGVQKYTIAKRLPYEGDLTGDSVEIIDGKAVLEGTGKVDTISGLRDCSNVTIDSVYMLDGKKHYAVDENTLMEV